MNHSALSGAPCTHRDGHVLCRTSRQPDRVWGRYPPPIPRGEQSGLLTRIAATVNVSLGEQDEKLAAFVATGIGDAGLRTIVLTSRRDFSRRTLPHMKTGILQFKAYHIAAPDRGRPRRCSSSITGTPATAHACNRPRRRWGRRHKHRGLRDQSARPDQGSWPGCRRRSRGFMLFRRTTLSTASRWAGSAEHRGLRDRSGSPDRG